MVQGQFTKEEATATIEAVNEVMKAFPKSKVGEFIGHFNDILLYLEASKRNAPEENKE